MSRNVIAFFSSDARELYKADVFRTLALPNKYVIHFRYRSEHIHDGILLQLDSLTNKGGVIFYASGNDINLDKDKRNITLHSIRNVIIKDIYRDKNIDLVHFSLELNDFVDCHPLANTVEQLLPPYVVVSEISVEDGPNHTWADRVTSIQDYLYNTLYYFIGSITYEGKELEPKYSDHDKASFYELNDESEYQVQFSFIGPQEGNIGIQVKDTSDVVSLAIPPGHSVGAPRDTAIFKLYTHTLAKQRSISYSRLSSNQIPSIDLTVELRWQIVRKHMKIILFGIFSALAALGVLGVSVAKEDFSTFAPGIGNLAIAVISIVLIGFAASLLYMIFNKK